MAGIDQAAEPLVALGIGLEVVPGCDVERGDPGLSPAPGEVVQVGAGAVGGIEERPGPPRAERRGEAEVGQGLEQVRESLIAAFAGRGRHPEYSARALPEAGHQRSAAPTLAGEDPGGLGDLEDRDFERALPDDGQFRAPLVESVLDLHPPAARTEAESFGDWGPALENHQRPCLGAREPRLRRERRIGA